MGIPARAAGTVRLAADEDCRITPTLLGVAAIISAIGGCVSTFLALRTTRNSEREQCIERLREARAEAEQVAAELHKRKMHDAS